MVESKKNLLKTNTSIKEDLDDLSNDFQFALKSIDAASDTFNLQIKSWAQEFIKQLTWICMPEAKIEYTESEPQDGAQLTLKIDQIKSQLPEETKDHRLTNQVPSLKPVARVYVTVCPNLNLKVPPVLHAPLKATVQSVINTSSDPKQL